MDTHVAVLHMAEQALSVTSPALAHTRTYFSDFIPLGLAGADLYRWADGRLTTAGWRRVNEWSDLGGGRYVATVEPANH